MQGDNNADYWDSKIKTGTVFISDYSSKKNDTVLIGLIVNCDEKNIAQKQYVLYIDYHF